MISVGYNNIWLEHNHLDLNPTTFYNYIKNSKVVFTSMFHGVMFSTKLAKLYRGRLDQKYPLFVLYNKSNVPKRLSDKKFYKKVYRSLLEGCLKVG